VGLSGSSSDVRFDYEGALRLARSLWSFAEDLEAAKGDRRSQAMDALRTWRGPFGDQFRDRVGDEQTSLASLVAALKTEADLWAAAWKQAMDEQNRRLYARMVDRMKAERSTLAKVGDFFTGFDYPPAPAPVRKPTPGSFLATACLGA
jgi:hypothetical protein